MAHICTSYLHRIPPPSVDLAGCCGPHDIVEEHVAAVDYVLYSSITGQTYDALLKVGDSTGGLKKA